METKYFKKSKKVAILISVIAVIGAILVFTLFNWTGQTIKSPENLEKSSLRLKWIPNAGFAGDFIAEDRGFWENQGLDVEVNEGGLGNSPIQLVASGSEDFGLATGDQLILARSQGIPVVAIAVIYQKNPLSFISLEESNINHPADLVEKKVGLTYTDDEPLYRSMINSLKIDENSINEVRVGFDLTPLLDNQVDVYPAFINTQGAELKQKGYSINSLSPEDYGIQSYSNLYFTTEDIIENEPEKVEKFLRGMVEAWNYVDNNREASVDSVYKFTSGIDKETLSFSLEETMKLVKPSTNSKIGWMTSEGWKNTQEVLLENNILDNPIDLEEAYTTEFLEKIYGGY